MKEFLSIGEMASIFNIDVQILRHYDKKGLLVPQIRNSENGRRMYRFDQMYPLATIRYLRKLGYSLNRIGTFLRARDVSGTIKTMQEQSALLRRQYEELIQTDTIIQNKLSFIKRESEKATSSVAVVKTFPVRDYVLIGEETSLFTSDLFYFYPTVGLYNGAEKRFGAYLFDDSYNVPVPKDTPADKFFRIPAGHYLCNYHMGPYSTIQQSISRLWEAGREKKLDDTVVTINIIDQFLESHPSNYLTELQIRITE